MIISDPSHSFQTSCDTAILPLDHDKNLGPYLGPRGHIPSSISCSIAMSWAVLRTYPSPISGDPPGTQMGHREPIKQPRDHRRSISLHGVGYTQRGRSTPGVGYTPGALATPGSEGYIRTLSHVLSLVLRLQSYIVTCVYLTTLLTHLLYYHLTTPTNRPILRYRSARRSTWHRSLIPSKGLRLDKTVRSNSSVERQIIDVGGPAQASITRKASNITVTS